jgi:hypothetical protein
VITAKLWEKGTDAGKPFDYTAWFSDTYVRTPTGWRYVFLTAKQLAPCSFCFATGVAARSSPRAVGSGSGPILCGAVSSLCQFFVLFRERRHRGAIQNCFQRPKLLIRAVGTPEINACYTPPRANRRISTQPRSQSPRHTRSAESQPKSQKSTPSQNCTPICLRP